MPVCLASSSSNSSEEDSSSRCSSPAPSSPNSDGLGLPCEVGDQQIEDDGGLAGKKRKRVRISAAAPLVLSGSSPCRDYLSEEERALSWWSATDFAAVKDALKRQCKQYRQNRRYSDCLTDAYNCACDMAEQQPGSYHGVRERASEMEVVVAAAAAEASEPTEPVAASATQQSGKADIFLNITQPQPAEGLLRWFEDQGPRGLEGYSSRLHAMRRQRHLLEMKQAVLFEQARQRVLPLSERNDELLAQQAAMASRRARTFAELLGQADAWAVQQDCVSNNNNSSMPSSCAGEASMENTFPENEQQDSARPTKRLKSDPTCKVDNSQEKIG